MDFTYTIYIQANPEQIWRGLTDPEMTMRYWRHVVAGGKILRSDWRKGSTWDLVHPDVDLVVSDPEQLVLESKPGRRLAFMWHSFTPEWAAEVGLDADAAEAWRAEPRSRVDIDLEDVGHGTTQVTVVHGEFQPESQVRDAISQGWPAVLSSLKTLLETGASLRTA